MPEALAYNLNFLHPLLMWSLLALAGYGMFLGIKAKRTRTADPEARKQLIKGRSSFIQKTLPRFGQTRTSSCS